MRKSRGAGRNSRVTVEELIGELHRTVDGLGEDGTGRADLKLLSRTLKELRHSFRFFDGLDLVYGFDRQAGTAQELPDDGGHQTRCFHVRQLAAKGPERGT